MNFEQIVKQMTREEIEQIFDKEVERLSKTWGPYEYLTESTRKTNELKLVMFDMGCVINVKYEWYESANLKSVLTSTGKLFTFPDEYFSPREINEKIQKGEEESEDDSDAD